MADRFNKLLRSSLSSAIFHAGRWGGIGTATSQGVRILAYHGMGGYQSPLSVTPQAFAAQMEYLATGGHRVISLEELARECRQVGELPDGAVVITSHDGYADDYHHGLPILQEYGFPATVFLATGFIGGEFQGGQVLNWSQIREMVRQGMAFGSHSVTHPFLTRVPLEAANWEVRESKLALEQALGRKAGFFCYPFGDFNDPAKAVVGECGYIGACTISPGANGPETDAFALKTTDIGPKDTIFDFEKNLAGAYDPLHRGMQLLAKDRFPDWYFGVKS